ncbi:MAG: phosphotransferase [Chloroflexi bacterium]|nr:MAG: phosphotransferase [Chloroflexota bacterium]
MALEEPAIIVVSGIQGAGKSTVARALAGRFERGVHIEADALQRMIVSGGEWASEAGEPAGEAEKQLRLRLHNACLLARSFVGDGFTAVVDDIIIGERFDHLRVELAGLPFRLVVLAPDVATVIARDKAREHSVGEEWACHLDEEQRRTMAGRGLWVDSSGQTAAETVDEVMSRLENKGLIEAKRPG